MEPYTLAILARQASTQQDRARKGDACQSHIVFDTQPRGLLPCLFRSTMGKRVKAPAKSASAPRWKGEEAYEHIRQSKHAMRSQVIKGGIARLSAENGEDVTNDDDTLYVWDDPQYVPDGEVMFSARRATFDKGWPHSKKKKWNPKPDALAMAGFYFTPTEDKDDTCACAYCHVVLGGWERDDNV